MSLKLRGMFLVALAAVLLVACGGDDAGSDAGSIEIHDAWAQPVAIDGMDHEGHGMDASATAGENHDHNMDASATMDEGAATGATGAVYLIIDNQSDEDDRLLGVSSDVAEAVEVHKSEIDDKGVMRMNPVEAIDVPAGEEVAFESGGYHIMLIGLHDDLVAGESFEVTLDFEEHGQIPVTVEIREP